MLIRLSIIFMVLCSMGFSFANEADFPKTFILDAAAIHEVKQRLAEGDDTLNPALERLLEEADRALDSGPFKVTSKDVYPPSGDKRDYMSVGPYWWPNPDTEDGLPYVRRDGVVNPDYRNFDNRGLGGMISSVNTLALAYYLTDHEPYAEHAAKLLRVWFLDKETGMNPHLQYAQAIPGRNQGRGIGLIETRNFGALTDSVGLLENSKHWKAADQSRLKLWFRIYLKWLRESANGKFAENYFNNIATWYDVQASAISLFVGDKATARKILGQSAERRIDSQIEPDGWQPYELARTRSLSYSLSNLVGMFCIASLAEHVDIDLWNYESEDGRSIRKALDVLIPYLLEEKEWEREQISGVSGVSWMTLLRQAAIKWNDPSYESHIEYVRNVNTSTHRINLQYPALSVKND